MISQQSMQKNILFRVDSSENIGSGHVMRCLTLADTLKEQGAKIIFICRDHKGNIIDCIETKGHKVFRLPAPSSPKNNLDWNQHASWLGISWDQDVHETINLLETLEWKPDLLIVDHYALDNNWELALRPFVDTIMVIDDLADRRHDCDFLLDQNFFDNLEKRYEDLISDRCLKLLGPSYSLLRPEFRETRVRKRKRHTNIKTIFIFFGGVDSTNETNKALKALLSIERHEIFVDVVVGEKNQHKSHIQALCKDFPNITFHSHIDNMYELMSRADLAIGAGGTTTWERFCLGIPSIVIAIADNQKETARYCCRCGCHIYIGDSSEVSRSDISAAIKTALQAPFLLEHMAEQAENLVDGKGTLRVVQSLVPPRIVLRPATSSDCHDIYNWRNAEETRLQIFNSEIIPFEVHQHWFEKSLEDENCILLIGEINDEPLGVLRFDLIGLEALVSVYLVPGQKTMGTGSQLIQAGSNWLRENRPDITKINAEIISANVASRKAFQKAGYSLNHLTYSKEL